MQLKLLLEQAILEESASANDVTSAIDRHERIIINYHTNGEDVASGARVIEVYVYGLTKAGNHAIRAFQPYGDTTTKVPSWKLFRIDRIVEWKPTGQMFTRPASDYYSWLGEFNRNGDKSLPVIFKLAKFGDDSDISAVAMNKILNTGTPKTDVYRTDTEDRMERLMQQISNPIKLDDLKPSKSTTKGGPVLKNRNEPEKAENGEEVFRTETERGMDRLMQQLDNPQKIDLSKFSKEKPEEKPEQPQEEPESEEEKEEVYKTETERSLERLRKQLNNPQKIDLDTIPSR